MPGDIVVPCAIRAVLAVGIKLVSVPQPKPMKWRIFTKFSGYVYRQEDLELIRFWGEMATLRFLGLQVCGCSTACGTVVSQ